jgi:hypothetical protein
MKRICGALLLAVMLTVMLAGCGFDVARPEIKEGRFNVSVTYEYNGEVKTASGVYVCKYDGVIWFNINGDPCVGLKESFEGDIKDGGVLPIGYTEDGGEIIIGLLMYPEYFMGMSNYAEFTPTASLELFYYEGGTVSESYNDPETLAKYGAKLISFEYDKPIENSYKPII